MTGFFNTTVFKTMAAALVLSAAIAMPAFSQAQAAPGMKVAMAMPMHAGSKMGRHGKRHMAHHMAAKDGDRYGMK
jgi:hypothetical protein